MYDTFDAATQCNTQKIKQVLLACHLNDSTKLSSIQRELPSSTQ